MGSRIMHSIIGHKIAKERVIEDRTSFVLGSIAPDAVSIHEDKNESHFFTGQHEDHSRTVDFDRFLHKYRSYIDQNNAYILGYYTHLIADDLWLRGFYLPWLQNRMRADETVQAAYHKDFRRLNGKLLHVYGITEELRSTFSHIPTMVDIDEIPARNVEKFVPFILGDMDDDQSTTQEPLNIFTLPQIIGYIETSVELALYHLQSHCKNI